MSSIRPIVRAITLTLTLTAPGSAPADLGPPAETAVPGLDFGDLEATVDAAFRAKMERYRVSGGVVVVVYRGEVVLSKGYGLADVARGVPVDPSRTLFRLGSISKPVTATAALSLVAEGALPLDDDLPSVIGVAVPKRFEAPVTLRHLLTHTSGFELTDIGDAVRRPEDVVPLESMVTDRMTTQYWPPGTTHAYSNHGITLAGLAVARAAGLPFADAVAKLVFTPLGMHRSSFGVLPEAMRDDLARGHAPAGDGFRPLPMDHSNVAPADGLVSTGDDMGRWMRALLGGGVLDGRRVLDPSVAEAMLKPQFAYVDSRPVSGLGLLFERQRGHRAPAHTGGQLGFSSHVVLVPEHELGILIALNMRAGRMRWEVLRDVLARHLPEKAGASAPTASGDPGAPPRSLTGRYRRADVPRSTFEKARALAPSFPELRVTLGRRHATPRRRAAHGLGREPILASRSGPRDPLRAGRRGPRPAAARRIGLGTGVVVVITALAHPGPLGRVADLRPFAPPRDRPSGPAASVAGRRLAIVDPAHDGRGLPGRDGRVRDPGRVDVDVVRLWRLARRSRDLVDARSGCTADHRRRARGTRPRAHPTARSAAGCARGRSGRGRDHGVARLLAPDRLRFASSHTWPKPPSAVSSAPLT